jgi:hypothetical protein
MNEQPEVVFTEMTAAFLQPNVHHVTNQHPCHQSLQPDDAAQNT